MQRGSDKRILESQLKGLELRFLKLCRPQQAEEATLEVARQKFFRRTSQKLVEI